MKALVLCAGHGTRLRPLTEKIAKPALPVVGIPTLWYSIWSILREVQPDRWIVNVGHAPETVVSALDLPEIRAFARISVDISDESSKVLGSSGALRKIKGWLGSDRLLVINGDSICFSPWRKMLELHVNRKALLTLHVRKFASAREPYTDVFVGPKGEVTGFGEKRGSGTMFAGSYIIEPSALERLPEGASELKTALLDPLSREGSLYALEESSPWFDTGNLQAFFDAQFEVPSKMREARALIETRMSEKAPGIWVPKDWPLSKKNRMRIKGPAVFLGSNEIWERSDGVFGPRFFGATDYLGFKDAEAESRLMGSPREKTLFFLDRSYALE